MLPGLSGLQTWSAWLLWVVGAPHYWQIPARGQKKTSLRYQSSGQAGGPGANPDSAILTLHAVHLYIGQNKQVWTMSSFFNFSLGIVQRSRGGSAALRSTYQARG